jgi:hypothetical protein
MSPWAAELEAIRAARARIAWDAVAWPHPSMDDDDPLWAQYDRRENLWNAPIRWSDPILGGTAILEPGDSPWGLMHVLHSFDRRTDAQPTIIAQVSGRLVHLWQQTSGSGPLSDWAERLRHRQRSAQLRVPDALANGYAVFISSTLVCRAHLPHQRMRFERLPIFAPQAVGAPIMPVPATLWPESLLADWTE